MYSVFKGSEDRLQDRLSEFITAVWHHDRGQAYVDKPKGRLFMNVGIPVSGGAFWLMPEETIWMVERGSMICFDKDGVQLSVSQCYAACLEALCIEKIQVILWYSSDEQVYTDLKRSGYIVRRAAFQSMVHITESLIDR